jgi:hypothetical protein
MDQTKPRFIGKRVTVTRTKDALTLTIGQKVERWQEAMLVAWVAAWLFCGIVFMREMLLAAGGMRIFLVITNSLWLFLLVRIGKVLLWRLGGNEIVTFSDGRVSIRNAFWNRGKTEQFLISNIFKPGLIKRDPGNFFAFLDNSFWVMGGDRCGFSYSGRKIVFGKQLESRDAEAVMRIFDQALREYK